MQCNKKSLIILASAALMAVLLSGCLNRQAKDAAPAANELAGQQAEDQQQEPSFRVDDPEPAAEGGLTDESGATDEIVQPLVKSYSHLALGNILTDSKDMALYIYIKDTEGTSACYDDCAAKWPPLLAVGEIKAESRLANELGMIERTDGTKQATYRGKPLYYYFEDTVSGEASGEGVNDAWFVVKLDQAENQSVPVSATEPKMVQ